MSLTLVKVAGANFRTDYDSDALNTEFMKRLGMGIRYIPARLAISRSLAMKAPLPVLTNNTEPGRAITGDTLFGSDYTLSVWLSLIIQHSGEKDIDIKRLTEIVGAHWRRGLQKLDEEWSQCNELREHFIQLLIELAELPQTTTQPSNQFQSDLSQTTHLSPVSSGFINVPLGEISLDSDTNEKIFWTPNARNSAPHSAIMGQTGTGKTLLAVSLLGSIRQQVPVPMLTFDFKGDLANSPISKNQTTLREVFNAQVIEPPRESIPLDVLALYQKDDIDITQAAIRFRKSFSSCLDKHLGDRQRTYVSDAASKALSIALSSGHCCELRHILTQLEKRYKESGVPEDGAITSMRELCAFGDLFTPTSTPSDFFQKSWIIKLPGTVPEECSKIVINLLLDALDKYLLSLNDATISEDGSRGLRILCMIDEAHRILKNKLPSLSNILRMSRSKGGSVMLISQSPDDFFVVEEVFLDNMGLVAAFTTTARQNAVKSIFGPNSNLSNLPSGHCLARVDKSLSQVRVWEDGDSF